MIKCQKQKFKSILSFQLALAKITVGDPQPPRKRRKTILLHEELKRVVDDYDNRLTEEFLKGVVSNIQFH